MADLSWLPEPLHHVALRVARADELCYSLAQENFAFSYSGPVELIERVSEGHCRMVVQAVKPVPPRIALLFSEAVSHLRAAIDNTLFHLAAAGHDGTLDPDKERAVYFPITQDAGKFTRWRKSMRQAGLPQLGEENALSERIRSLQPFADADRSIPHTDEAIAEVQGTEVHRVHPLLLLQDYSNTDKHRMLRVSVHKGVAEIDRMNGAAVERAWVDLGVGDQLSTTPVGQYMELSVSTFAALQRPATQVHVGPAAELNELISYVAHHLVPVLVTGQPRAQGLPLRMDLSAPGLTVAERIAGAGYESAQQRIQPVVELGLRVSNATPPRRYQQVIDEPGQPA